MIKIGGHGTSTTYDIEVSVVLGVGFWMMQE